MSLFDFSEQYYQSMANDYVLILTETLISNKISFTLDNRLLALLVKKLQIFVKKILIEKYNFN